MITIQCECDDCGGTGLYSGMCEGPGVAVVCLGCGGSGAKTIRVKEFTGRHKKRGIKTITRSRGSFIATGVGPTGPSMTYSEFERAYPEAKRA